jgi:hypothetical protein
MSDRLSFRQTIALTAAGTALLTAGAIIGGQALRRSIRTEKLKESITKELDIPADLWTGEENVHIFDAEGTTARRDTKERQWEDGQFDEDLIREQVRLHLRVAVWLLFACLIHPSIMNSLLATIAFWGTKR